MAGIHLDHNIARDTAVASRRHGHDVVTASDQQEERASDATLLLAATQQGRLLISHDSHDFILLHDAWERWFTAYSTVPSPPHAGILIIPQQDYRRGFWLPDVAAREIDIFLEQHVSLMGQLHEWTPSRGWVRR